MRFIFSAVVLLFAICRLSAQSYQLPTKELTDSFSVIYKQTDKTSNFFNRLMTTSQAFFHPENKFLTGIVSAIKKRDKISTDSSIVFIYDTILRYYIKNYGWDEYPGVLEKSKEIYAAYNDKICPCFQEKIKILSIRPLRENDINECSTRLLGDTSYINTLRRVAGTKTVNEMYEISQQSLIYSMQHCPALTGYFLDIIKENSIFNYSYIIDNKFKSADYDIATLYKKGDTAGLISLFPEYRKFILQIKQVAKLLDNGNMSIHQKKHISPSGALTFTNTYYKYSNKIPVISGQVVYTVKEELPESPILSFKFFSSDKIANKTAIMKELQSEESIEPPPPPMELPPGVKMKKN